jgi:hypothetical protein
MTDIPENYSTSRDYNYEEGRIFESPRLIFPTWEIYQRDYPKWVRDFLTSLQMPAELTYAQTATDEKILADYGKHPTKEDPYQYGSGQTEEEFLAYRKTLVDQYIEEPCKDLCYQIMDAGFYTFMSNAYAAGAKGVWWKLDGYPCKGPKIFTDLGTGITYNRSNEPREVIERFKFTVRPGNQISAPGHECD